MYYDIRNSCDSALQSNIYGKGFTKLLQPLSVGTDVNLHQDTLGSAKRQGSIKNGLASNASKHVQFFNFKTATKLWLSTT